MRGDGMAIHLPEETPPAPNVQGLRILEELKNHQEGWPETSGEETQQMLRVARAGGMYGPVPTDD